MAYNGPSTVSTQVQRLPGEQHASQPRIPSREQLEGLILFHFMCYDPMGKDHPLDGYTHLENVCVRKVQGENSFLASVEKRGGIAPGDAQKATVNVLTFDAFPLLMPTKEDGSRRNRRPSSLRSAAAPNKRRRSCSSMASTSISYFTSGRWRTASCRKLCRGARTLWRWSRRSTATSCSFSATTFTRTEDS